MTACKLSILLVLFAIVSSLSNPSKVDAALVDDVCKQTSDPPFCLNVFNTDPRIGAATDLPRLSLLSISITATHVDDTVNRIGEISGGINDPVGKKRIDTCRTDYQRARDQLQEAYSSSTKNAYTDVIDRVRDATNDVIDCQDIYRISPPISESPVAADNQKFVKLAGIILTINDMRIRG